MVNPVPSLCECEVLPKRCNQTQLFSPWSSGMAHGDSSWPLVRYLGRRADRERLGRAEVSSKCGWAGGPKRLSLEYSPVRSLRC